jgi:8-oxo-dGTP pyrophosphatase MutT (NUDIX family)
MPERRTVFRTEWFEVEAQSFDDVAALRGQPHYRINSPDGVIVLALTDEDEVLVIRQFRPALGAHVLELPSGGVDPPETPLEAARRELYEETGYVCREVVPVGPGRLMTSRHSCREFMFFGTGAVRDASFVPREEIEVLRVTTAEFRRLVVSGDFEQLAALAVVLLMDWKLGRPLDRAVLEADRPRT